MTAPEHSPAPRRWPVRLVLQQGVAEPGSTDAADQTGAVATVPAADDPDTDADQGGSSLADSAPSARSAMPSGDNHGTVRAGGSESVPDAVAAEMTSHHVVGPQEREPTAGAQPSSDHLHLGTPAGEPIGAPGAPGTGWETRQAVEQAYRAALRALRSYPDRYLAVIRAQSDAVVAEMRREADGDVASIRRAVAMETARLEEQAEESVAQRQGALAAQLEAETTRLETELARAQADAAAFEARFVAFETETAEFLARMTGVDASALPAGSALHPTSTPWGTSQTAAGTEAIHDHASMWHVLGGGSEADPSVEQAAAAGDAFSGRNGVAPGPLSDIETEIPVAPDGSGADGGVTPDVAAVAAVAGETAAADPTATTINVRGLPEVASIAAFMRLLVRLPGVEAVQVRSAPHGEVSFAMSHSADLDLRAQIELLPQFEVRILSAAPGTLMVEASEV